MNDIGSLERWCREANKAFKYLQSVRDNEPEFYNLALRQLFPAAFDEEEEEEGLPLTPLMAPDTLMSYR